MRKPLTILLLFLALSAVVAGQSKDEKWNELVAVQDRERVALHNRQQSELKLLTEIQRTEIAANIATGDLWREMIKGHAAEREAALKRHAAERADMVRVHAAERVVFRNPAQKYQPAVSHR